MLLHDSVPCQAVATGLALPQLRFALDAELGGQAPCYLVGLAADAGRDRPGRRTSWSSGP